MMNKNRLTAYFIIISIIILITSINVHAQLSPYMGFNFYGNPYDYGWNQPLTMAGIYPLVTAGINLLAIVRFVLLVNFPVMSGLKKDGIIDRYLLVVSIHLSPPERWQCLA